MMEMCGPSSTLCAVRMPLVWNARFFLDRFDQFRDPSVMLAATKLLHHMSRIFQSNSAPPGNPAGIRIDSKRRRRLMEKRMVMGHKADDHEEQTQYQQSM